MSGTDPFLNTNPPVRNLLQHVFVPTLVGDTLGGYNTQLDLINVNDVYLTNTIASRMLATTDNAGLLTSTDYGANWSVLNTGGTFTLNRCTGIAWNGNIFVAVGAGPNTILTSLDGITWTPASNGFTGGVPGGWDVVWTGKVWIAVGSGTNIVLRSLDGIIWTPPTILPAAGVLYGISYSRERLVAVGASGALGVICYSNDDGITWTNSGPNFAYAAYDIVSNGSRWVAVGQQLAVGNGNSTIFYSDDNAVTWVAAIGTKFLTTGTSIDYHGGRFVAVGQDFGSSTNTILTSTDGIIWNVPIGSKFTNYGDTILWNGKRWVTTGSNTGGLPAPVLISDNGVLWTSSSGAAVPNSGISQSFGLGSNNVWETLPTSLNDIISRFANSLTNLSGELN